MLDVAQFNSQNKGVFHQNQYYRPNPNSPVYSLPQVSLTLAEASEIESLTSSDLPVFALHSLQRGIMYQLSSVELSFWT